MAQFIGQTLLQAPVNRTPQQLKLLGDTLGEAVTKYKDKAASEAIGEAYESGGLLEASKIAFDRGRPDLAMRLSHMDQQNKSRAAAQEHQKAMLGIAQSRLGIAQQGAARAAAADQRKQEMLRLLMGGIAGPQGAPPGVSPTVSPVPGVQAPPGATTPPPLAAPPAGAAPGGTYSPQLELLAGIAGYPEAAKTMRSVRQSSPGFLANQERAKITARESVKKEMERPQAQARAKEAIASAGQAAQMATKLISDPGLPAATGPVSSRFMTTREPTADFETSLDTLKTKIFVTAIGRMRELSKSGGALGSVTENEITKMENSMRPLSLRQSDAKMKENLRNVAKDFNESMARISKSYEAEYGEALPYQPIPIPAGGAAPKKTRTGVNWGFN